MPQSLRYNKLKDTAREAPLKFRPARLKVTVRLDDGISQTATLEVLMQIT